VQHSVAQWFRRRQFRATKHAPGMRMLTPCPTFPSAMQNREPTAGICPWHAKTSEPPSLNFLVPTALYLANTTVA
jgi:hypothetical protein